MNLQDSVASLKGVGKKRLPLLEKLHIETIEDLLRFFPRRYEDRRQAVPIMTAPIGKEVLIIGTVMSKQMVGSPYNRRRLLKVQIEDNTGSLELLFFNGKCCSNRCKVKKAFGHPSCSIGRTRRKVVP